MPPFTEAQINNAVLLEGRFWNTSGVLTNPTTVTLTVTNPAGTVTSYAQATLTNTSTGIWTKSITPTTAGVWQYTFDGDGTIEAANTGYLLVGGTASSTVCSAWAAVNDLDPCDSTAVSEASEGVKEQALMSASDLLWRWSGFKYPGLCLDTVRPCAQGADVQHDPMYDYGIGWGGWWSWWPAWGYCQCNASPHRDCGCTYLSEIRLGRAPIQGILSVKEDGATLSPSAYRIDDNQFLVRIDGEAWKCCQDLTQPDTADDTWSVTMVWGRTPPASGVTAAVDLAAQIIKDCIAGDCAVPSTASNIVRQGVSVQLIAPERYGRDANGNLTVGLRSVDRFLSAVGTSRPGLVMSPESRAQVRRVGT